MSSDENRKYSLKDQDVLSYRIIDHQSDNIDSMIAETHLFPIDVLTGRLSGLFAQPQLLFKMAAGKTGLGLGAWF